MNDVTAQHAHPALRASDAEREQAVALLQRSFAEGRLTLAELEERAGAAYAARTSAQLFDLTADLPGARQQPPRPRVILDTRLLCILLCACPPAGVAYWLLSLRKATPAIAARLHRTWVSRAEHFLMRHPQHPLTEQLGPTAVPGQLARSLSAVGLRER